MMDIVSKQNGISKYLQKFDVKLKLGILLPSLTPKYQMLCSLIL